MNHDQLQNRDAPETKQIGLIGSTGGGTATLGHTNPWEFVDLISRHLAGICDAQVKLQTVFFFSMDDGGGFDGATGNEPATLLFIQNYPVKKTEHGILSHVNEQAQKMEEFLAREIREGRIHGLICVSCEPSLFAQTLQAASELNLPVTGTGGSSLSQASSKYKLRLIGNAGGSVATTPLTKAISFASAFAQHWKLMYSPWQADVKRKNPTWKSVLNSCLPAFWSVCLLKRLLTTTIFIDWTPVRGDLLIVLEAYALPIVCSVIMATSRRETESAAMAAILAGCSCRKTVLGGLFAGWLVSKFEEQLLYLCLLHWNVPATMTNLLTAGLVGIVTAVIMSPISPYLSMLTELYRNFVRTYIWTESDKDEGILRCLFLSCLGPLICYGGKIGWCKCLKSQRLNF